MSSPLFWFLINLLCIGIQGFFSMLEMAALSFNRVRLEYYVSKKMKRAIWLQSLLQRPSRFFGTIMLGVNIALQLGSQSSREFYRSIGLDADLAPITQIFLVVILAELAPLFAARRFSEHVVMLGIPVVYFTSRLFAPIIWTIGKLTHFVYRFFGKQGEEFDVFISREELQKVLESHEEESEFNIIVENIFSLKNKAATHVMTPLSKINLIPASTTVGNLREKISHSSQRFIPLYHKTKSNIISVANVRDFLRVTDEKQIRDYARPPWFITSTTKLTPILAQFRRNKQSVAVVLDPNGSAIGLLTLDAILEEIFGEHSTDSSPPQSRELPVIERTFPGNMKISAFNHQYGTNLNPHGVETLAQLIVTLLDHPPENGDAIVIDRFELIAEETSLLGIKSVTIKTLET
ncbi:MAG: hypothetical protein S4CHLAM123_12000 [Chlamydiales bacterium]|nr:hypothetical protein [Chlamydiales bacterium]